MMKDMFFKQFFCVFFCRIDRFRGERQIWAAQPTRAYFLRASFAVRLRMRRIPFRAHALLSGSDERKTWR